MIDNASKIHLDVYTAAEGKIMIELNWLSEEMGKCENKLVRKHFDCF